MALPGSSIARDRRTALYFHNPELFVRQLRAELILFQTDAHRLGLRSALRLNGTSDLPWERLHPHLFEESPQIQLYDDFPQIQFYDYTKLFSRMLNFLQAAQHRSSWPANYHLTFSADNSNIKQVQKILDAGGNVAVVFWPDLPTTWWNFPVIDGDVHDARFLDQSPAIVGLKAKGLARVDLSGLTFRPCPHCSPLVEELQLIAAWSDSHYHTLHQCPTCRFKLPARWKHPRTDTLAA